MGKFTADLDMTADVHLPNTTYGCASVLSYGTVQELGIVRLVTLGRRYQILRTIAPSLFLISWTATTYIPVNEVVFQHQS